MFAQFLINGIIDGCGFALVAFGLGLIYRTTKVLHIAHGAVFVVASYAFYLFTQSIGLPILPGILIALLIAATVGSCTEMFVYYPLHKRKASPGVFIVASLGIYIVLINVLAMVFSNETKTIANWNESIYHIGTIILTKTQLIQGISALVILPTLLIGLKKTRIGRAIKAVSDNPELAAVIGIKIKRIRIIVFFIGSMLAGIGACLFALDRAFNPFIGMDILFISAAAVIVGGIFVFGGAIAGALSIGILQHLIILQTSARWEEAVTFVLLIMFLLMRPQGLLGGRKRVEEQ